ncbi:MAG: hypothetical protein LBJ79_03280 [Endomicrobium sp.]|nr:hypothetical protein [Endomicrobium sp.]
MEISRLGEKTRAVVTAIVEIGHIFIASEGRGYFEKFLGMHGKGNKKGGSRRGSEEYRDKGYAGSR